MASKYAGYMGKVMMVDLTTETVAEYPWTDEQRELYLGGKIMAARILCDHLTGKETAFSEENWVVMNTDDQLADMVTDRNPMVPLLFWSGTLKNYPDKKSVKITTIQDLLFDY